MANSFESAALAGKQLLKDLKDEAKLLHDELLKSATTLNTMMKSSGNNNVANTLKDINTELQKFNQISAKQYENIKKTNTARTSLNKQTRQEVIDQRALRKEVDLEAKAQSRVVGAYQRLIAKRQQAKKTLQDLIIAKGKDNALTLKAEKNYNRLTNQVNKANKATSNFSKGGLGGAIKGFTNLLGAFGIVGGVSLIGDLTKNIFNLTKQFDAFRFTMQKTIGDVVELAQTNEFLDEITQNYGTNLITTTERYIKFDAAARQSNISLEETQKIFGSVTKAAGVLGLKTDELSGVYLALEQMLSKGKVTTEELRRQLGERLPGAFGIMADAIGVTTSELDKMLKAGEILSKDALPKFAEQLEKAYGIESVNKIDTLQAAQTRLSNSWSMFVRDISGDDTIIQGTFKGVLNFMSSLLDGIKDIGSEIKDAFTSEAVKEFERTQNRFAQKQQEQVEKLNSFKDANVRINAALTQRFALEENLAKKMEESGKYTSNGIEYSVSAEQAAKSTRELIKEIEDFNGSGADAEKFIKSLRRQYLGLSDDTIATAFARIKGIDSVIKKTEDQIEAEKAVIDSSKEVNKELVVRLKNLKSLSDLMASNTKESTLGTAQTINMTKAIKEQISSIDEILKDLPEWSKEYIILKKQSDALKESLEGIKATQGMEDLKKWSEDFTKKQEEAREEAIKLANALDDYFGKFEDDFFSQAGFDFLGELVTDFDKFKKLLEGSEDDWAVYATSVMEIGQEMFNFLNQNQDAYFQNQLFRLEQERDIAIAFAGDSATARDEINRQYEERRREIQQKQAESDRNIALFNIAIDTAQAVVASFIRDPSGISAAIIGAIGAAQLALVASQPLPEFFRGTMNAPEGWAMVDEKRPEIHTDNKGNIKSFGESKANMRYLDRGDKIYTSRESYFQKELGGILEGNDILPYNQMFDMVAPTINLDSGLKKEDFIREIRGMRNDIMKKETSIININKSGFTSSVIKGSATKHKQNNILTLKGGIV